MGYWFNSHVRFEEKYSRPNRLVVGFNYSDGNNTRQSYIFLNQNVTIPTYGIKTTDTSNLESLVFTLETTPELSDYKKRVYVAKYDSDTYDFLEIKYPAWQITVNGNNEHVIQIDLPKDKKLIDLLPRQFQTGVYDRTFRYDNDWLLRKTEIDKRLELAINAKENISNIQKEVKRIAKTEAPKGKACRLEREINNFLGQSNESIESIDLRKYQILRKIIDRNEVAKVITQFKDSVELYSRIANFSLHQLDQNNSFSYNPETQDFEIYLNSRKGFEVNGARLTSGELRQQPIAYFDIEIPNFLTDTEKKDLDERKSLLKKYEHASESEKPELTLRISGLESKLTKHVAGHKIIPWDEKYSPDISWYPILVKLPDGTEVRELHTLRETSLKEINGFKIYQHHGEDNLLQSIQDTLKRYNVLICANQNIPFDVIHSRDAAREEGIDDFDVIVKGKAPGKDVSISKVYQRLRESHIFLDTLRYAHEAMTWRRASQPQGNFKLESIAKYLFGEGAFKKSLNYEQLRELEVKAINGDLEAANKIAEYAVSDVLIVKRIIEETPFIEDTVKRVNLAPYLTPTEIAFSNRSLRRMHDFRHWKNEHNHRTYGYDAKIDQDEAQIFKKRFASIKRQKLEKAGINIPGHYEVYPEVLQVYMPLEHWLMAEICQVDPVWTNYFASLSSEPLERIAQLKAPKAFAGKILEKYNSVMNADKRYDNKLKSIQMSRSEAGLFFRDFEERAPSGLLTPYYLSLENLRNQFRSIYVALGKEDRAKVRTKRLTSKKKQAEFSLSQFLQIDNYDLEKLRKLAGEFMPKLSEKRQRELQRFLSNFDTAERLGKTLVNYAIPTYSKIAPEDIVYVTFLRHELIKKSEEFIQDFGIRANVDHPGSASLRTAIGRFFDSTSKELGKRRTQVTDHKGDYLYLYGGNLDFSELNSTALIPIRTIKDYVVSQSKEVEKDDNQLELLAA